MNHEISDTFEYHRLTLLSGHWVDIRRCARCEAALICQHEPALHRSRLQSLKLRWYHVNLRLQMMNASRKERQCHAPKR